MTPARRAIPVFLSLGLAGYLGVGAGQPCEGGVDVQHLVETFGSGGGKLVEVQARATAAPFLALLATGVIDEDAAHGLGRGGEEVAAAVPVLHAVHIHQPHEGLMNQGRGLQRLARFFRGQPLSGELP